MSRWAFLLITLALVLAVAAVFLPVEQLLLGLHRSALTHPTLAAWLVGAAFLFGIVFLLPVSPVVMLAGFLFGLAKGFILIWATGMLASSLAFWISRSWARDWVERRMSNRALFVAIDRAIERNGLWIVLLTRLAMVFPLGPLNYSLGMSSVRYRDFLLGTTVGVIPPFLLVTYLGATAGSATAILGQGVWPEGHSLFLGLLTLAIVVLVSTLIARSAIKVLRNELAATTKERRPGS